MGDVAHFLPKFRWGGVTASPGNSRVSIDMEYEFRKVVPDYVMQIGGGKGTSKPLEEGRPEDAIANYWDAVEQLAKLKVDIIVLRGVPISAYLGRETVLGLLAETREKYGIAATSSLEDIVTAAHHLGVRTLTIGSRWDSGLNGRVAAYCEEAGVQVTAIITPDLPEGRSFEEQLGSTLELGRMAAFADPAAEAIAVPGRAMALHVVPVLEQEFGRPVITMLNADVWRVLVHPGVIPPVDGWGRLLASP